MKNVKEAIYEALSGKTVLGDVSSAWPSGSASNYPYTTVYRVSAIVSKIDGSLKDFDELYSVDLFAKTMTEVENMELAVNEAMDTLPYAVSAEHGTDLYETDTSIYHKVLRFRVKSKNI